MRFAVCTCATLVAVGVARAETSFTPPQFSFEGSLGLSRTTNVLFNPNNPQYDNYASPTAGLFAQGALGEGWNYKFGAEYFTERYADFPVANFSTVRLGTSISRNFDGLIVRFGYYAWLNYSDDFNTRFPAYHDAFVLLVRPFPLEHGWSITPIAGFTRRYITDGLPAFSRVSASVILGIPLDKWTLQLKPGAYYDLYNGFAGFIRRDFSPSFSTTLSYPVNNHFTLTLGVTLSMRDSNIPARDYRKLDAGPGLDVSFKF